MEGPCFSPVVITGGWLPVCPSPILSLHSTNTTASALLSDAFSKQVKGVDGDRTFLHPWIEHDKVKDKGA
jgi:hypothetical protein